jgi:hypothetical protein
MERKRSTAIIASWAVALLLMALVLPASLQAQETRGRITGRVTDTSKAVVPGATVTVTDATRGTVVSTTTNEQGLFVVTYLLPGTYNVKIELEGFRKQIREGVLLQIAETRSLAFVLEVGPVQEAISVTAEAITVNTSDANMGLVVDQQRLASLPLIHGDPYKIMGLASGVTFGGNARLDRPFEPSHITNFAYNGTRGLRSDLLIDGLPSTATANANEVIATYVPPSDLVQEFKVQTATFDSQFGNTEGGVTSMSIKSGTNRFRGTAYYYAEPSGLGANDYFGKLRGQAKIESSSNRPGFTVGGPIAKDKTFFMFGYERITDTRPRFDIAGTSWVPTEALRRGDFSAYSSKILIYDPLTRTGTTTYIGTAFPNNQIPADRISPVSKAILDYYSPPKNPGTDPAAGPAGNITDSTLAEKTRSYDTITARVDQKLTTNNRMFGRFSWYARNSHYNDYLNSTASGTLFHFGSWQAVVDDVHVFNPTTVLNVRVGYNRFDRNADMDHPEAWGFDLTKLGFPSQYNSFISEDLRRFPRLDFTTGDVVSVAFGNDIRPVTTKTVAAVLNKSLGAHSLKTGVEIRQYNERSQPNGNAQSGQYAFSNTYTRQSSASGTDYQGLQAYAAFLLGMPATTSWSVLANYDEYSVTSGFFVQDDWRISDRLTLNLGLRYEVENALVERDNKSVSGFDYAYTQPIEPTVQANYAALTDTTPNPITGQTLKATVPTLSVKGGLKFAGVDGGNGLYNTPKDTFLPRLGFAFQLTPKTVIRGGAGLFAGFLGERRGDVIQTGWSQTTTAAVRYNANGAPIGADMASAFLTTPLIQPVGNAAGRQTYLGQGISFFNQDPKLSKQLRYQIGFQRELPGGMTFEAAYVGNYGYDIEITRNINALPIQYLSTDNARTAAMVANNTWLTGSVANPFAGLLPGTSLNNATVARSQLLLPYPEFGAINTTNNDGKSWYNAGQFSLQKRFSKGYTIGVAYTVSKWEQATEYLNAADPNPTRMISDLDSTHRVSISGIYQLPFGKGQRFGSGASGWVDALIGGWQVQGVYTFQTGLPVVFSNDVFYNGGDVALSDPTVSKWFNTAAFTSLLTDPVSNNSTPVNHVRTFPLRLTEVRTDAINSMDLSFLKNTRLPGNKQLQLRLEYINFLDNPLFPGPVVTATTNTFGQIVASNQSNYARRAQVGVKFLF